ncbi:creB [[Candida] subhashii]|uniref:Ubiquitin carboxyl-terminal hydrolase n=1 Tax=[Candida] subhashii TaxID=561895 RepID=A0A8J5QHC8_9ASCO|nr:creB [[Candida] subhashii]KAG7664701.1 creB [[Candida] subhashii]
MTRAYHPPPPPLDLPYGDGSHKIFGMENFGNTCYCNSILQCLYYTESFRKHLVSHNYTKHDPKLSVLGSRPHNFTFKYDQLYQKRLREQPNNAPISAGSGNSGIGSNEDRPKSSRKSSIFGIKFNYSSSTVGQTSNPGDDCRKFAQYIKEANNCDCLNFDQRIKISKSPEFSKLAILVTRPTNEVTGSSTKVDYSQSSSMLLNNDQQMQQSAPEGSIGSTSSSIIVGIPHPEPTLLNPINPFNPNPNVDQRKRSALINGPIINLDSSLQSEDKEDSALLYALKDMFEAMIENKSTIGVVSPVHFIYKLKEKNYLFRQNNMHHDAHEFFNYLINEIIESLNKEVGIDNNWCNNIFQGLITNETKCLSCEAVTSKHEFFLDLSVDIPPGQCAYSLNHSLNNFSKSETLSNQNKFYCNTCSSLQEAVKTIKLKKLPEVLVINLKRFKYDESVDKMVKLFDSISYPFGLRLFNTTDDEQESHLYELYALVIHIGGGPMHGHYVSICKIKAGLWLLFDDETVELVEDSYVMRFFGNGPGLASAYILFYSKSHATANSDDINFGFNVNDMYKGEDFATFQQLNPQSSPIISSKNHSMSKELVEEQQNENSKSETSSLGSFNGSEQRRSSMFKSFKFDSSSSKEEKPPSRSSSHKEPKEKKSWVGGLKRRDNKNDSNSDKKSGTSISSGSTTNNVERKKSIFGFKRK